MSMVYVVMVDEWNQRLDSAWSSPEDAIARAREYLEKRWPVEEDDDPVEALGSDRDGVLEAFHRSNSYTTVWRLDVETGGCDRRGNDASDDRELKTTILKAEVS